MEARQNLSFPNTTKDFNMTISEKNVLPEERRNHERFTAMEGVFAIIRSAPSKLDQIKDMSRGEIAIAIFKSEPILTGQIIDISRSGLAFRYFSSEEQSNQSVELDILFADDRFYLKNLPFKTISDLGVDNEFSYSSQNRKLMRVQFGELDLHQISQLDYLIQNCTMERPADQDHIQLDDSESVGLEMRI
jgi:hypothetical protein